MKLDRLATNVRETVEILVLPLFVQQTPVSRKQSTCFGTGTYFLRFFSHCSLFFFSSRRRHTRLQGDWSSDVCSSDLDRPQRLARRMHSSLRSSSARHRRRRGSAPRRTAHRRSRPHPPPRRASPPRSNRSEERRVGKECRSLWAQHH